jgi:hypothetical protein
MRNGLLGIWRGAEILVYGRDGILQERRVLKRSAPAELGACS